MPGRTRAGGEPIIAKAPMPQRVPRRTVDLLISTHGLSSFCLGVAFPYTAIYLAGRTGIGTGGVAAFYAVSGIANLGVALLLSTGLLKLQGVALAALGNGLWFIGYLLLPLATSIPLLLVSAMAVGAGQGAFLAAIIPIMNSLVTPGERRQMFARRYAVLNATLAAGSLTAGCVTLLIPRSAIGAFLVVNAVGILPLTVVLVRNRRAVADARDANAAGPAPATAPAPAPGATLLTLALPVAAVQLAAYLFGFSQFEVTAPLVTVKLMHLALVVVSVLLTINVIVIVVAQRPMTRFLAKRPEIFGLRVGMALWAAGYGIAAASAPAPIALRVTGLLAYAVIYGLGESAYSSSFHPWLISRVPAQDLTRASALTNSMMGVGNFAGPTIGVVLAVTGKASLVWLGLGACCCVVLTGMRILGAWAVIGRPASS